MTPDLVTVLVAVIIVLFAVALWYGAQSLRLRQDLAETREALRRIVVALDEARLR